MTYLILAILLVLSALSSGLNLGVMSLGPHDLKRKAELGDTRAAKIYPIRKKGNLLLVTLLLNNVAVNAVIAIFLGSIADGVIAGIVSTLLITIFGEIIPQAVFSRYALAIGSRLVGVMRVIIFILYPFAAPMAYLLDKVLGEELPTLYSKHELKEVLMEHAENEKSEIKRDETRIAQGAFSFGDKLVSEVMVPRSQVVFIHEEDVLDDRTIASLEKHGYSRVPVMQADNAKVTGILYMYDLVDPKNRDKRAAAVADDKVYYVNGSQNLDEVLNGFLKKKHHLFIVVNEFEEYVGIISIEDVLEQILGREIVDEFDEYENLREVAKRKADRISRRREKIG